MKTRAPRQTELAFRPRGGRRPGAGRKPQGERAGVSHRARPALASRFPVHVTLRVRRHVWNLRSRRCFRVIARAFEAARGREGFRVVHYCVQGNHLHLIVEATDAGHLARAMQSLCARIALGLNRLMERHGAVFADRYHARILKTPAEVRAALAYVLHNSRRHAVQSGRSPGAGSVDPYSSGASFDGWAPCGAEGGNGVEGGNGAEGGSGAEGGTGARHAPGEGVGPPGGVDGTNLVSTARTWLLSEGWHRCGLIGLDEVPGPRPRTRRRPRAGPGRT